MRFEQEREAGVLRGEADDVGQDFFKRNERKIGRYEIESPSRFKIAYVGIFADFYASVGTERRMELVASHVNGRNPGGAVREKNLHEASRGRSDVKTLDSVQAYVFGREKSFELNGASGDVCRSRIFGDHHGRGVGIVDFECRFFRENSINLHEPRFNQKFRPIAGDGTVFGKIEVEAHSKIGKTAPRPEPFGLYAGFEEFLKRRSEIVAFEGEVDGRLNESELVAGIVADAFHFETVNIAIGHHSRERVGKTKFAVLAGGSSRFFDIIEHFGSNDVFSNGSEAGIRFFRLRFLQEAIYLVDAAFGKGGFDDSV